MLILEEGEAVIGSAPIPRTSFYGLLVGFEGDFTLLERVFFGANPRVFNAVKNY